MLSLFIVSVWRYSGWTNLNNEECSLWKSWGKWKSSLLMNGINPRSFLIKRSLTCSSTFLRICSQHSPWQFDWSSLEHEHYNSDMADWERKFWVERAAGLFSIRFLSFKILQSLVISELVGLICGRSVNSSENLPRRSLIFVSLLAACKIFLLILKSICYNKSDGLWPSSNSFGLIALNVLFCTSPYF